MIEKTIKAKCEENGVRFQHVSCVYNSQRCNVCGWTYIGNRIEEDKTIFKCTKCGYSAHADVNASCNIKDRDSLIKLPYLFLKNKPSIKGFFWNRLNLVNGEGEEFIVPFDQKENN